MIAVRGHPVFALLSDLQVQALHQAARAVSSAFKALLAQVVHHGAAAETATRCREQRFHAPPQHQFPRRDDLARLVSPVIVSTALNTQLPAQLRYRPVSRVIAYKPVLHFISLAKYWLAFFKISFSIRSWRTSWRNRFSSSRSSPLSRAPLASSSN